MSKIVDNLIAYRILSMLVTPYQDTKAYKLGIIDDKGTTLKKSSSLKTSEEKEAFTYLHRLVFNMKKIINKVGGESKLKSIIASLWLVREYYETKDRATSLMESRYTRILEALNNDVVLAEEELAVRKFFEEVPANATGSATVTNEPVIKNKIKKPLTRKSMEC
jgi:hypothetical protein